MVVSWDVCGDFVEWGVCGGEMEGVGDGYECGASWCVCMHDIPLFFRNQGQRVGDQTMVTSCNTPEDSACHVRPTRHHSHHHRTHPLSDHDTHP